MTDFTAAIEEANRTFDALCQVRHDKVVEAEGIFTFLTDDVITQALEALADTAVMCRKQFIKLLMYQSLIEDEIPNKVDMGAESFRRAGQDSE